VSGAARETKRGCGQVNNYFARKSGLGH